MKQDLLVLVAQEEEAMEVPTALVEMRELQTRVVAAAVVAQIPLELFGEQAAQAALAL